MNPTPELRFVEREIPSHSDGLLVEVTTCTTARILQQKWEEVEFIHDMNRVTTSEWRDVPLVKEADL